MSDETVTAAFLIIGNEILSGRTKDKNLGFLAEKLTETGIRLSEVRVVRDEQAEIITAVLALSKPIPMSSHRAVSARPMMTSHAPLSPQLSTRR